MLKTVLGLWVLVGARVALAQVSPTPDMKDAPPASSLEAPPLAAPVPQQVPVVSDAMLQRQPPPRQRVSSWREAVQIMRRQSPRLRQLAASTKEARAVSTQALAGALPSLTTRAGVNRELLLGERRGAARVAFGPGEIPDPATTWVAAAALRVPLLAVDSWLDRGAAQAAVRAATLDEGSEERFEIAILSDALIAAATAERLAEVSRISLESALAALDLHRRRASLGVANALDIVRIEQEVSVSRAQVVSANDAVLRAREDLGAALGVAEPFSVAPSLRVEDLLVEAQRECHGSTDVNARAEVKASAARLEAAKRSESALVGRFLPRVDAVSGVGYLSDRNASINGEHVAWSVGAELSLTLYDGGLRFGQQAQRRAQVDRAREELREAKIRATAVVTATQRAITTAESGLEVAARTRQMAEEAARLARLAYASGIGTSFDLVDAARQQRDAEVDYTIYAFRVASARLAAFLALADCRP